MGIKKHYPVRTAGVLKLRILRIGIGVNLAWSSAKVRVIPQVLEIFGELTVHPYSTSGLTTVSVGKRLKSRSEVHNSQTP